MSIAELNRHAVSIEDHALYRFSLGGFCSHEVEAGIDLIVRICEGTPERFRGSENANPAQFRPETSSAAIDGVAMRTFPLAFVYDFASKWIAQAGRFTLSRDSRQGAQDHTNRRHVLSHVLSEEH